MCDIDVLDFNNWFYTCKRCNKKFSKEMDISQMNSNKYVNENFNNENFKLIYSSIASTKLFCIGCSIYNTDLINSTIF